MAAPTKRVGRLVVALGIGIMLLTLPFQDPAVAIAGAAVVTAGVVVERHRMGWRLARVLGALGIVVTVGLLGFALYALTAGAYGAIAALIVTPVALAIAAVSRAAIRTRPAESPDEPRGPPGQRGGGSVAPCKPM